MYMKKIIIISLSALLVTTGCNSNTLKTDTNISKEKNQTVVKMSNNINKNKESATTEEDVVKYVENIKKKVTNITSKDNISKKNKKTLKRHFITLADFIFYDGKIKGKTFDDLSDEAKEKVLNTFDKVDNNIEEVIPGYKETIKKASKKAYTNVKEKAKELKDSIINKYREEVGEEAYNNTVKAYEEDTDNLKNAYSKVYEKVKEKSSSAYHKAKDHVSSWYSDFKESSD